MKKVYFYGLLLFSTALIITYSCTASEEHQATTSLTPNNYKTPPPPNNNTVTPQRPVLNVFAGTDNQVILPTDYSNLKGSYSYSGNVNDIANLVWEKISGPSTYIIENPNSSDTKVSKMSKGTYEFELTITDKAGLTAKDAVTIVVGEFSSPPKEIIFTDLGWYCPMGCTSTIKNIYSHLPASSVLRVYIQRDNSADWKEVIPLSQYTTADNYYYNLYNGSLEIYSNDIGVWDTPNIKIVY